MAAATLRRLGWPIAVAGAAALILVQALHGERPPLWQEDRVPGLLESVSPDQIRWVEVERGTSRWRFRRDSAMGWAMVAGERPPPADYAAKLELGLRLLHNTATLRTLAEADLAADTAQYGLQPGALRVSVGIGEQPALVVTFGARNALGLSTYVRVGERRDLMLLPDYVLETWRQAVPSG